MTESTKQTLTLKSIWIFSLWTIAGYFLSDIHIRYIYPYAVDLSIDLITWLKQYDLFNGPSIIKELILYLFSYCFQIILVFIGAVLLALATGIKLIWAFGFILGAVAIGLYVLIEPIMIYPITLSNMPAYILRPLIAGIVIYLIIIPLVVWIGCALGKVMRRKYV